MSQALRAWVVMAAVVVVALLGNIAGGQEVVSAPMQQDRTYGRLPLAFEQNQGQADTHIRFISHGAGTVVLLADTETVLVSGEERGTASAAIKLKLVGAREASAAAEERLPGLTNYFLGSDPSRWRTGVPTYARVRFSAVYPGINLVYYGHERRLEHDFELAPGADPSVIRFTVEGGQKLRLDPSGDLVIENGNRSVRIKRPVAYQDSPNGRRQVSAKYVVRRNREIGFQLGKYDRSQRLVIDPALVYSTLLGGSGGDTAYAVTADASGNAYVFGSTSSTNFPVSGAIQATPMGNGDLFVTKINPSGTAVLFSTYFGGSFWDNPTGIALDGNGNVIIAGSTWSSDLPLVRAFQTYHGINRQHGFLASLTPDGSALNYSTYFGGSEGEEDLNGLAVDPAGNAYITGFANTADFPTTNSALCSRKPEYPYQDMVFVAKITPEPAIGFSTLICSTTQPSTQIKFESKAIAVDLNSNVYITGSATAGYPTTAGVVQPTWQADPMYSPGTNAFISKLNPVGTGFVYSTYLGGRGPDGGRGIVADADGNAYVAGETSSPNFPVTTGAFQTTLKSVTGDGCCATFVAKLDPLGTRLMYSTFLAGTRQASNSWTWPKGIALDAQRQAYVSGLTTQQDFPLVKATQTAIAPWGSVYISVFDPAGSSLTFSTVIGGAFRTSPAEVQPIAVPAPGTIFVAGTTEDSDMPTTAGAFQTSIVATPDAFVARFAASQAGPALCVTPTSLAFGKVRTNSISSPQSVTLRNCGEAPLVVNSVAIDTPQFTATSNCGTLAPDATCLVQVTFTPMDNINYLGQLRIVSNAPYAPPIQVSGSGTGPILSLSWVGNMDFGDQLVGVASPAHTGLLVNTGDMVLTISRITITGDFSYTISCSGGSSCPISVIFTPMTTGYRSGTITIYSDSPTSPDLIPLSGTGTTTYPIPVISHLSPNSGAAGATALHVEVQGGGFLSGTKVIWNGNQRDTTYVDNRTVAVDLTAADLIAMNEATVQVFNPTPGGGYSNTKLFTTYKVINQKIFEMIYDPVSQKIFASVPQNSSWDTSPPPANPDTVIPIDPATGQLSAPVAAGSRPRKLALSDDSKYLYVALDGENAVQRLDLPTLQTNLRINLGNSPYLGPYSVGDMAVLPGNPDAVAIARTVNASPNVGGMVVYDGAVARPNTTPSHTGPEMIAFSSSAARAYSYGGGGFYRLDVDTSGITIKDVASNLGGGYVMKFADGLVYTSNGDVVDPELRQELGEYADVLWTVGVIPRSSAGRTFLLDEFQRRILVYDQQSFQLTETINFGDPVYNTLGWWSFVQWGVDGLAFRNDNSVILLRTSLLNPSPTDLPMPVLTSLSPNKIDEAGSSFALTVTGTGFRPESRIRWNNSERATTYVSSTQLTATINDTDIVRSGYATVQVFNPAPGGGVAETWFTIEPVLQLTPTNLAFNPQAPGTTSSARTVAVKNVSGAAVALGAITITDDFLQTSNCPSQLAPAATCNVSVTFAPKTAGVHAGILTVPFGINGAKMLSVNGSAPGGTLTVSRNTVTFADTVVGASSSETVTLTNSGTDALSIGGFSISGPFSQTSTCGSSLSAAANCTVTVSFKPTAVGSQTGILMINHNAAGGPTTISLAGEAIDFAVSAGNGTTSATITAGQNATYNLTVSSSGGFSGTVALSCTGAPAASTCSLSPASLDVPTHNTFVVTVATTARVSGTQSTPGSSSALVPPLLWTALALLCFFGSASRRRLRFAFALILLAMAIMPACGGGSGGTNPPPHGTAPGTYTLTVTATYGSVTRSTNLTLVVN